MNSHAHIAQTFLFMVLIPRKKCVCVYRYIYMYVCMYVSFCYSLTVLNSLSIVVRTC